MIHRIENNAIVETASLPYITGPSSCQTVQAVCDITGQDWREDGEQVQPNPDTEKLGRYIISETITKEVIQLTSEELAERLAEWRSTAKVTQRQARVYLARAGLLAAIDAQVAALGGEAQITWEYSQEVQRLNPFVLALPFTPEQMDQMFKDAALM